MMAHMLLLLDFIQHPSNTHRQLVLTVTKVTNLITKVQLTACSDLANEAKGPFDHIYTLL